MGACLVAGWLVGLALAVLAAFLISPAALRAAGLSGIPTLAGVLFGTAVLAGMTSLPSVEPSLAILGSSMVRLMLATLTGIVIHQAAAPEPRAFWLSFLFTYACILAAEVASARRILMPAPAAAPASPASPQEAARP